MSSSPLRCAMSLEMWAVAAVAVVDAAGHPLLLRTYTSPKHVLESPEAPQQAHLYVGPEDIIKIHFLLFASLDQCDELWQARRQHLQNAAAAKQASSSTGKTSRSSVTGAPAPTSTTRPPSFGGGASFASPSSSTAGAAASAAAAGRGGASMSSSLAASAAASTTAAAGTAQPSPTARLVTSATDARFTGKLIHSHRFFSYGFCSATGIKTLLVTVGCEAPQDAVLPLCRAIYEAASAALCNPFRTPSLSWQAQQALLEKSFRELMVNLQGYTHAQGAEGQGSGASAAAAETAATYAGFHGVPGECEFSWPTAATGSSLRGSSTNQPTLALSETFNAQLRTILSTFTVTTQSCIMH